MNVNIQGILGASVPFGFFAMVILSLYFYFRAKTKERTALIEKLGEGVDVSFLQKKKDPNAFLRKGVFLVSIGLGVLAGYFLSFLIEEEKEFAAYFSMIALFAGSGLVASRFIVQKLSKKE